MKIVLATRKDDPFCRMAEALVRGIHPDVIVAYPSDMETLDWIRSGSRLISFLYPKVIPAHVLNLCAGRFNFHPGPPEYPGIGCYNFALYDGATTYGSTLHIMEATPDTGKILAVDHFEIAKNETVESLRNRTCSRMLLLLAEFLRGRIPILTGLGVTEWDRKPYTRAELDALCELTPDMDAAEMHRRIRATTYPGKPGAVLKINGLEFVPK